MMSTKYPGVIEADCWTCATERFNAAVQEAINNGAPDTFATRLGTPTTFLGHPSMYSKCGNKRCPCTAHHDNPCTGSNEPGQAGSLYP